MYSQTTTTTTMSSDSSQSDSRLTVADILSSMASGGEPITPTALPSFEGYSTGVLTQTTPTLTPTTLRSIEQTFIELQNVPLQQIQHQNQAGFVTPIVNPVLATSVASLSNSTSSSVSPPPSTYQTLSVKTGTSSSSSSGNESPLWSIGSPGVVVKKNPNRSMGGRRPTKNEKLTPEEEERRRMRRERNKLAAARCRKRRLDHTNCLIQETDCLEEKRLSLQNEIQELQTQKDELEFILDAHKVVCKLQKHNHNGHRNHNNHHDSEDVKPILSDIVPLVPTCTSSASTNSVSSSTSTPRDTSSNDNTRNRHQPLVVSSTYVMPLKPVQRPNTLNLPSRTTVPSSSAMTTHHSNTISKMTLAEATGIAISTPSSGIFNFEALMEGGTGLTPVTCSSSLLMPSIPTCSTQQRSSSSDLSSPDTINPPKLVSL